MAMKMYVMEKDIESGVKFGICNAEYYVFFNENWHKINVDNIDEAKRIYKKLCFTHSIDEAKRKNEILCG